MERPHCSVPGCHLLVMGRLGERPAGDPLRGRYKTWVNTSDRCARHEAQRQKQRPVHVEDFDPAKHL